MVLYQIWCHAVCKAAVLILLDSFINLSFSRLQIKMLDTAYPSISPRPLGQLPGKIVHFSHDWYERVRLKDDKWLGKDFSGITQISTMDVTSNSSQFPWKSKGQRRPHFTGCGQRQLFPAWPSKSGYMSQFSVSREKGLSNHQLQHF